MDKLITLQENVTNLQAIIDDKQRQNNNVINEFIEQYYLRGIAFDNTIQCCVLNFFSHNNYNKIAFDGITNYTNVLIPFLRKNSIQIIYISTSSNNYKSYLDCKVYDRRLRSIPPVDAIICTADSTSSTSIIKKLDSFISCPIYHVSDLFKTPAPRKPIKKNYMFYRELDPKDYATELCIWYKRHTGHDLNLLHPVTFSEKIQWLKLNDHNKLKTILCDKYAVRDWIKNKIGEKYLIPLFGVFDTPNDINYDILPNTFVIKCTHASGTNIIVNNKNTLNKNETSIKLNAWLSLNYAFKFGLELQYKDITPRIIIEKKLENQGVGELFDYKFWCFNGKVEYIQFITNRFHGGIQTAFYDKYWKKQNFTTHSLSNLMKKDIEKPNNLDEMIHLAQILSSSFNYVRVDLYRLDDGSIYFGEMTFTPSSGLIAFSDRTTAQNISKLLLL